MTDHDDREDALARLRDVADADAGRLLPSNAPHATVNVLDTESASPVSKRDPEPEVLYDERTALKAWPLRHPFIIDGVRVAALRFREPSFADVEACVTGRITEHELHARMASVDVKVLRALRWGDSEIMTLVARTIAPELRSR